MIICLCHRVTDRDLARAAREGCASFEALQDETRVGTGCGACLDHARATFEGRCAKPCAQGSAPARCTAGRVSVDRAGFAA